jgi:hypothetical protein
MMNPNDVSLVRDTNWFTKEGIVLKSVWDKITWIMAWVCGSPKPLGCKLQQN